MVVDRRRCLVVAVLLASADAVRPAVATRPPAVRTAAPVMIMDQLKKIADDGALAVSAPRPAAASPPEHSSAMVPPARRPPLTVGSRRHAGEAGRSREGCRGAGCSQAGRGAGSRLARPRSSGPPLLLATAPPRALPLPPPPALASPLPSTSKTRAAPRVTAFLSSHTHTLLAHSPQTLSSHLSLFPSETLAQ